jgi:hypothetical protein
LEIPSFIAGLLAFLFIFALMGIMFFILREDRDRTVPMLDTVGPYDVVKSENLLARSDAPFLAIVTLAAMELIVDTLIVVSTLQGAGTYLIGTMLAIATFLAAAILTVYRSSFMGDALLRKPRLERIAARLSEEAHGIEDHE